MKRFALAALAVITLLGFTACDLLGNKDAGGPGGTTDDVFSGTGLSNSSSTWWLKGSFDSWDQQGGSGAGDNAVTGAATHFFSVDSLNSNLLGFTMTIPTTGLRKTDYKFVVMGPAAAGSEASRVKYSFVYPSGTSVLSDNTVYTLVPSTTAGATDIAFVASATSYTVKVDVSNPTSPKIKLVPGSTASSAFSEQEMADLVAIKGAAFDFGWTSQGKTASIYTYDAANHKVIFSNLGAGGKGGAYVISTMSGDFKGAALDLSTLTQGVSTTLNLLNSGSDATFTNFPNFDTKLKIEVTLDAAGLTPADKYKFAITMTSTGTSTWLDPATAPSTSPMTNGTGGGSSWGATLGSIGTAISGSNLLVKVSFSTPGSGNNVFVLLDNPAVTTGALTADLAGDLTTGWGDFGISANTANLNPDLALWGYRDPGVTFNSGGVKSLTSDGTTLTGTSLKSVQVVNGSNGDIWFQIPLSALGLTSANNNLRAVVLFGKTQGDGGFHSAIPATLMTKDVSGDKDCVADVSAVASVALSGL